MVNRAGRARDAGAKKRIVTGVAISATELCAADIRLRDGWRATIDAPAADGGSWPSLASAFAELARAIGVDSGVVAISLMPPLTEVRRLELPPLKDDELQRLLSRNATRYFVTARTPQIVGTESTGRRAKGAPVRVVAGSASARIVAAIRAAALQSGWTVESVAPAQSAWAAASVALWPVPAKQNAWSLIASQDRTDLLQIEGGRLVGVRRFRAGAADTASIAETLGAGARVGIAGVLDARQELSAALSAHSISANGPGGEWSNAAEDPALLSAYFAGREVGPILRSDETAAVERDRVKRAAWMLGAAAVMLVVLAGLVELWGVHRQLGIVRAERARIRPQIAATMIGRTTVDATSRHLAVLNSVDVTQPEWSAVIATLSQAITDDAYLTSVRVRGDSLIIDGLAEHASRVFDALERSKVLIDVKSAAPVRRELQEDGTALDRFTIAARIVAPMAASTSIPTSDRVPSSSARRGQ